MIKGITALVAAVTIAALASTSRADSVTFQVVSGQFGSGTAGTSVSKLYSGGNGTATVSFVANTATQSFSGVNDNETLSALDFGTFSVSGSGTSTVGINDSFTLTILLIDPTSATGGTTATLSGSLKDGGPNQDLVIEFPTGLTLPNSGLPDVVFTFDSITLSEVGGQSSSSLSGSATYHAASVAPLPGVAAAGISLLGLTALARRRKLLATA
jgi:hypothetical protein